MFNIEDDPSEKVNLWATHLDVVKTIQAKLKVARARRPKQALAWFQMPLDKWQETAMIPGECYGFETADKCMFTHPWLNETVLDQDLELEDATITLYKSLRALVLVLIVVVLFILGSVFWVLRYLLCSNSATKPHAKGKQE